MTGLPGWCNQQYLERFIGGYMSIVNEVEDYSYFGKIATVELRDGHLHVTFEWWAVGVDENNSRSMRHTGGWVQSASLERKVSLYAPANPLKVGDHDMVLYRAICGTPARMLVLDGGEIMDETLAFLQAGSSRVQEEDIRLRDPNNPIDEDPKPLGSHFAVELWGVDTHGNQRLSERITPPNNEPQ